MKSSWVQTLVMTVALFGLTNPLATRAQDDEPTQERSKVVQKTSEATTIVVVDDESETHTTIHPLSLTKEAQAEGTYQVKIRSVKEGEGATPQAKVLAKAFMVDSEGRIKEIKTGEGASIVIVQHDGKVLKFGAHAAPQAQGKQFRIKLDGDALGDKTDNKKGYLRLHVHSEGDDHPEKKVQRYEFRLKDPEAHLNNGASPEKGRARLQLHKEEGAAPHIIKIEGKASQSEGKALQLHGEQPLRLHIEKHDDALHAHGLKTVVIRQRGDGENKEVEVEVIQKDDDNTEHRVIRLKGEETNVKKALAVIKRSEDSTSDSPQDGTHSNVEVEVIQLVDGENQIMIPHGKKEDVAKIEAIIKMIEQQMKAAAPKQLKGNIQIKIMDDDQATIIKGEKADVEKAKALVKKIHLHAADAIQKHLTEDLRIEIIKDDQTIAIKGDKADVEKAKAMIKKIQLQAKDAVQKHLQGDVHIEMIKDDQTIIIKGDKADVEKTRARLKKAEHDAKIEAQKQLPAGVRLRVLELGEDDAENKVIILEGDDAAVKKSQDVLKTIERAFDEASDAKSKVKSKIEALDIEKQKQLIAKLKDRIAELEAQLKKMKQDR